jgi:hypothetical protein
MPPCPYSRARRSEQGRTDWQQRRDGKFVFDADRDGFWSAEARGADYVARVMIRAGGEEEPHKGPSPFLVIGFLVCCSVRPFNTICSATERADRVHKLSGPASAAVNILDF